MSETLPGLIVVDTCDGETSVAEEREVLAGLVVLLTTTFPFAKLLPMTLNSLSVESATIDVSDNELIVGGSNSTVGLRIWKYIGGALTEQPATLHAEVVHR